APITPRPASSRARSSSTLDWRTFTCARTTAASEDFSDASACDRFALNRVGSIWAMTCPSLTWLLKSAPSFWMVPETCDPTCTVTTAFRAPVAVTVDSTVPLSRRTVRKVAGAVDREARHAQTPPAASTATTTKPFDIPFDRAIRGQQSSRPGANLPRYAGWGQRPHFGAKCYAVV